MDCTAFTCILKDEMNKTLDTNCVLIALDTFFVGGVTNMVHGLNSFQGPNQQHHNTW